MIDIYSKMEIALSKFTILPKTPPTFQSYKFKGMMAVALIARMVLGSLDKV